MLDARSDVVTTAMNDVVLVSGTKDGELVDTDVLVELKELPQR